MTYRLSFLIALFVLLTDSLFGQNRPAPSYLLTQSLPDSVNNTALVSINGNSTTLSDVLDTYKGKKVLIDFWASWCRDCLVTLPKYNNLRKKTKDLNVVYLLLSVDKDDKQWKSAISKFKIEGNHFRFVKGWKNPLSNYVDLDWIPRYMVIDEEGNITEPKSVHVDDNSLFEALSNVEKQP